VGPAFSAFIVSACPRREQRTGCQIFAVVAQCNNVPQFVTIYLQYHRAGPHKTGAATPLANQKSALPVWYANHISRAPFGSLLTF
jgi:hypothetical protein